ncbi:transglutaminase family protein [Paeniroseomonas aquatica]|uniref:transglutaminase-like domain-containing protein n=1 Tax=Paeniroseomonas aquatica TaxID=373043 RepID=UPI0036163AF1
MPGGPADPFAQRTFGGLPGGYARVNGICNWIHDHVDYRAGSSDEQSSAMDTILDRAGVCRDFAHLAIACCRAMGIPARYVSAYAWRLDPPDFHAVFEAWLQGPTGGAWYIFDATRKAAPNGLVRIGIGRDAAEVAFASPSAPSRPRSPGSGSRRPAPPKGRSPPPRSASRAEPRSVVEGAADLVLLQVQLVAQGAVGLGIHGIGPLGEVLARRLDGDEPQPELGLELLALRRQILPSMLARSARSSYSCTSSAAAAACAVVSG